MLYQSFSSFLFRNVLLIVLGEEQINTGHEICMQMVHLLNAVRAFVRAKAPKTDISNVTISKKMKE